MSDNGPSTASASAIKEIAAKIRSGEMVFVLGAGACLRTDGKCPPAGRELRTKIARKIDYSANGGLEIGDVPLSTVAQHYELKNNRNELVDLLRELIGSTDFSPSPIHQGVVQISAAIPTTNLIVTTNYDTLTESALQKLGKPFDVLVQFPYRPSDDLLYEFKPNHLALYKMHGSFDQLGGQQDRDSLVITDDDYIEFLATMQQRNCIPLQIIPRLANSHLLFLGYSLQDWDFLVLYKSIIESKNRAKIKLSYAVQRPFVAEGQYGVFKQRYWENTKGYWLSKHIRTLEMLQEEFMALLLQELGLEPSRVH